VPRWLAHLLIVLGWLLTPGWAWAASHVGLWLGALIALRFTSPFVMLAIAGTGALIFGFVVLWTWVRFMRHLPHLLSHHMAPRASEEQAAIAAAD
jgi:FtsH-binding integral membrane protein